MTSCCFMPVRASAANTQVLKDYWAKVPQGRQSFDLIRLSAPESNIRGQQEVRDVVIFNMINDVVGGKSTPEADPSSCLPQRSPRRSLGCSTVCCSPGATPSRIRPT